MAVVGKPTRQPNEVQDYDIDFSEWMPSGDTIASVALSCSPTATIPPSYAVSGKVVKVWTYQSMVAGTTYKITVSVTTNDGRVKEAELLVKVKEI